MQFTSSLLLVICLQATAATSFGQKVNIKERNAKLGKIFKEIRKQTDYNFIYSNETLRDASPVTIDVRNASIRSVLDYCFKNQPLVYAIDSNVIVVRQKPFASLHREADPPPPVTGTVTDSLGNPLLGVTIKVRGSDQGGRY